MTSLVRSTRAEGVTTVTLDAPARRNSLSTQLVDELRAALVATAADPETRVVVLDATGPTFCAGADLRDPPDPLHVVHLFEELWACSKPVVAQIRGGARAGGIGLVAAADIAVATTDATFAFSEVRIGVAPAIIGVLCARRMSTRSWGRYALTGEVFDAVAAVGAGLLTVAVPTDELTARVGQFVADLKRGEPGAMSATKEFSHRVAPLPVADGFAEAAKTSAALFASDAAAEGMRAFRERRAPSWVTSLDS